MNGARNTETNQLSECAFIIIIQRHSCMNLFFSFLVVHIANIYFLNRHTTFNKGQGILRCTNKDKYFFDGPQLYE